MHLLSLLAVGFVLGLTGAMAPGPLLTVTITESTRRGGIAGPLLVLGHGILELTLLVLIVFGLGRVLHNPVLFTFISFAGGAILIYMGAGNLRGLKDYRIAPGPGEEARGLHPIISGIVISLSNPYWFIWWLTIGMGYVIFAKGLGLPGILAFFVGHISSDLAWYSFVSYGICLGGRYVKTTVLKAVLLFCSLFLIGFGVYFIVQGFNFLPRFA